MPSETERSGDVQRLIERIEKTWAWVNDDVRRLAVYALTATQQPPATHKVEDEAVACRHEPYLGRCAHCGIEFKNGRPVTRATRAETALAEAEKALEPFAEHLDEMKFDLDNKNQPLPDELAVGWVYVTNGDFRNARSALATIRDTREGKADADS